MAITSITNPSSSSSSTSSVTSPAGIQAGDLLIILDWGANLSGPAPSEVTPTGFTSIASRITNTWVSCNIWYKIADGSESSTSYTLCGGTDTIRKLFAVFRANEAITAVTVGSAVGQVTDSNPTSKSITASSGVAPLLVLCGWDNDTSSNAISPRTQSPTTTEISNTTHQYLGWIAYTSSPADQSFDMDDEGTNNTLIGCYLQLTGSASTYTSRFFSVF